MDAYRDSIHAQIGASDYDLAGSDNDSIAPTLADMAQWKQESARFLHDVREQLNEILAELDRTLTGELAMPVETFMPAIAAADGPSEAAPDSDNDDRISALKARLASKLHNFEEAGDRNNQANSSWEAGK